MTVFKKKAAGQKKSRELRWKKKKWVNKREKSRRKKLYRGFTCDLAHDHPFILTKWNTWKLRKTRLVSLVFLFPPILFPQSVILLVCRARNVSYLAKLEQEK